MGGAYALQPTLLNKRARHIEGRGDFGCEDRFGNGSEKGFVACWYRTVFRFLYKKKELYEIILYVVNIEY